MPPPVNGKSPFPVDAGHGAKSADFRDTVDSIYLFIDGGTHISKEFDPMNSIFCMILI